MLRAALILGLAGFSCGSGELPGIGEACGVLCAPGLTCSPGKFCEKSCKCDGGAWCAPSSLATGCPSSAACVVAEEGGGGMCARLCGGDAGCPPGEGACASAPDGARLCVGDGYRWGGRDAGAPTD
jgi:hypothetical protein